MCGKTGLQEYVGRIIVGIRVERVVCRDSVSYCCRISVPNGKSYVGRWKNFCARFHFSSIHAYSYYKTLEWGRNGIDTYVVESQTFQCGFSLPY